MFTIIFQTLYMQINNRLLEQFNYAYRDEDPNCPNVVEVAYGSRRIIMTRDHEHIKTVLTSKFSDFGKGRFVHEASSPFLGDSIFTTDGHLWQKSRGLIRPMFTTDRLRDIEIFTKWSEKLMIKMPPSGQTVDICELFYRMTLDVSTDFLLGQPVDALENPNNEFGRAFTDVQRMQVIRVIIL